MTNAIDRILSTPLIKSNRLKLAVITLSLIISGIVSACVRMGYHVKWIAPATVIILLISLFLIGLGYLSLALLFCLQGTAYLMVERKIPAIILFALSLALLTRGIIAEITRTKKISARLQL